jgi:hypothetical protein
MHILQVGKPENWLSRLEIPEPRVCNSPTMKSAAGPAGLFTVQEIRHHYDQFAWPIVVIGATTFTMDSS